MEQLHLKVRNSSKLEVASPTVFPYEQPLIGNKWVRAFDGTKKQVQRMTADGYRPTKLGHEYFKYAKDQFHVEYPTRLARPIGKKTRQGTAQRWQLDNETFDYHPRMEPITVGQLRTLSLRQQTRTKKRPHWRPHKPGSALKAPSRLWTQPHAKKQNTMWWSMTRPTTMFVT